MTGLKKKVALISGAGSGIGKATALLFAKEGASISAVDWNPASAAETVASINHNGGQAIAITADVSKVVDVRNMIQKTVEAYGQLDILFNNAGVMQPLKTTVETLEAEWDRVIDINLKGTFLAMKYGIPEMLKSGGGSIVNNASMAGLIGFTHMPAYSASKAGVILLTKCAALEYADQNIRINCVCPGTIATPIADSLATDPNLVDFEQHRKQIPLKRRGTPEEIARAVLFLASDETSYITGSALNVDGGVIAR